MADAAARSLQWRRCAAGRDAGGGAGAPQPDRVQPRHDPLGQPRAARGGGRDGAVRGRDVDPGRCQWCLPIQRQRWRPPSSFPGPTRSSPGWPGATASRCATTGRRTNSGEAASMRGSRPSASPVPQMICYQPSPRPNAHGRHHGASGRGRSRATRRSSPSTRPRTRHTACRPKCSRTSSTLRTLVLEDRSAHMVVARPRRRAGGNGDDLRERRGGQRAVGGHDPHRPWHRSGGARHHRGDQPGLRSRGDLVHAAGLPDGRTRVPRGSATRPSTTTSNSCAGPGRRAAEAIAIGPTGQAPAPGDGPGSQKPSSPRT